MSDEKVEEIRELALAIDPRIILFEGYSPKKTDQYIGELLFWRNIVNIYGVFSDCDVVQIKGRDNLVALMEQYSLITHTEYEKAKLLWQDISKLRTWFCHNNDETLYYARRNSNYIEKYLNRVFILKSEKPRNLEQVSREDWNVLAYDIVSRFDEYLEILRKGLCAWKEMKTTKKILDDWIVIFSNALYSDRELKSCVLADLAQYNEAKRCRTSVNFTAIDSMARVYDKQLKEVGFSEKNIQTQLMEISCRISKQEILLNAISKVIDV